MHILSILVSPAFIIVVVVVVVLVRVGRMRLLPIGLVSKILSFLLRRLLVIIVAILRISGVSVSLIWVTRAPA